MKKMSAILKKIIIVILCLFVVGSLAFGGYVAYLVSHPHMARHTIEEYQSQFADISFTDVDGNTLKLEPDHLQTDNKSGIVFYPGAMVDPNAYIPLMAELAQHGYVCYIEKVPCYMAILAQEQAMETIEGEKEIEHWYIAGHSMGGMSATNFAKEHLDLLDGIIIYGARTYADLSKENISLLTIYGTLDTVLGDSYNKYKDHNPANTKAYIIDGGNHAQFGDYGKQAADSQATITPQEQREQATAAALEYLLNN